MSCSTFSIKMLYLENCFLLACVVGKASFSALTTYEDMFHSWIRDTRKP
jgi:hypothetical protein